MKIYELDERRIDMQALAIKAKQLLTKGMSEQQVIELLVKEGTPVRLAQQAVAAAQISEAPIQMDPSEPNNPTVYGHEKANPMTLKGRIMQARAQLKELAKMADSNDIEVWEQITKLAKGGMFMGLEQNFEQIRHGIGELAKKRKRGGTGSRGINKGIGETATAGATSAGNVASVSNKQSNPTKKGKYGAPEAPQHTNKDGTVKNALNTNDNLFGGKTVKR
jgi:hypothetical protein